MDIKTIPVAFVAIMVGAVAFGAMLPIFQDVTTTETTFINEGYFYMTEYETTDGINLYWDADNPTKLTVNYVVYDLPTVDSGNTTYTVLATDNWIIRTNGLTYAQFMDAGGPRISASTDEVNKRTLTVTAINGGAEVTNTQQSDSAITYTEMYCISGDTGDYVSIMKKANVPAYVFGDTPLVAMGRSTVGSNPNIGISIRGTIDDGVTVTQFSGTTVSIGDVTINAEKVKGYDDVYLFDNITFPATLGGNTTTLVYSYIIVPSEITAEKSAHGDDSFNTIVNLIPLVIGMGLLLIAVWWFVVRKF